MDQVVGCIDEGDFDEWMDGWCVQGVCGSEWLCKIDSWLVGLGYIF